MSDYHIRIVDDNVILGITFLGAFFAAITFNVLIYLWCLLTQKIFLKLNSDKAKRITYLSALFQPFIFFIPAIHYSQHADPYLPSSLNVFLSFVLFSCAVGRVWTVFQGVRAEPNGNSLVGLFSIIFCFDAWFAFAYLSSVYWNF